VKSNKKNKGQSRFESRNEVKKELSISLPQVINMDEIAVMTDDVLLEKLRELETDRDRVLEEKYDPQPWEIEAAYVRRELQLRRTRHNLHEDYLDSLEREAQELLAIENRYPVADLDNSAFMFFSN
jgi:hypothetical protein